MVPSILSLLFVAYIFSNTNHTFTGEFSLLQFFTKDCENPKLKKMLTVTYIIGPGADPLKYHYFPGVPYLKA